MITDRPAYQQDVAVESEGDAAGHVVTGTHRLPPLPCCKEHPRRALEIVCKSCEAPICSTCKETDHSECQKTWDQKCAKGGLPRSIVFEGVEKAATRLKDEVLGRLCAESIARERAVREAAEVVLKRKEEVSNQLVLRKKVLETARQGLLKAVNERFDALEAELEAAAVEKQEALIEQSKGLEAAALGLKRAKDSAEKTLGPVVVEERPVEIVEACLKLKQELGAVYRASQVSAPVREANLHVAINALETIVGTVKGLGWSGALDVDMAKCGLSKQGEGLFVEPGGRFEVTLTTRDKLGQQLKAGGLKVAATVTPKNGVQGDVAVKDKGDGTYTIGFKSKPIEGSGGDMKVKLSVQVGGTVVPGCPLSISRFDSRIVTALGRIEGLHNLLPRKRLELCYRASRDGWDAAHFHRLCDNKGPTLVVAREKAHSNIFGGYAGVAWAQDGKYAHDDSAFLFTFKPAEMAPKKLPCVRQNVACHMVALQGPTFGDGYDLMISSNAHSANGSCSKLGKGYELPSGCDSKNYLAGSETFRLLELEVFLVK